MNHEREIDQYVPSFGAEEGVLLPTMSTSCTYAWNIT